MWLFALLHMQASCYPAVFPWIPCVYGCVWWNGLVWKKNVKEKSRNSQWNGIIEVRQITLPCNFFIVKFTKAMSVNRKQCKIISTKGNIIGYLLKSIEGFCDLIRSRDQGSCDSACPSKVSTPMHFVSILASDIK